MVHGIEAAQVHDYQKLKKSTIIDDCDMDFFTSDLLQNRLLIHPQKVDMLK